jgi:hypothetical protein
MFPGWPIDRRLNVMAVNSRAFEDSRLWDPQRLEARFFGSWEGRRSIIRLGATFVGRDDLMTGADVVGWLDRFGVDGLLQR